MLSVKKVKNRSAAFGPSAAITAGTAVVAVRSMVAGSVVVVASEVGLFGKFMVAFSGPDDSHKGRYVSYIGPRAGGQAGFFRVHSRPHADGFSPSVSRCRMR